MKSVDANSIQDLGRNRNFYLIPDYQREYVWETEEGKKAHIEQFLNDIQNEQETNENEKYFIGSIILIEKSRRSKTILEVVDGQQRLITITLILCALRSILEETYSTSKKIAVDRVLTVVKGWLDEIDLNTDKPSPRLELQYADTGNFLDNLIKEGVIQEEKDKEATPLARMRVSYEYIYKYLCNKYINPDSKNKFSSNNLTKFATYFLNNVEIVVIKSEDLARGIRLFETINQRGADLNAMDLVKNLLFREVKEEDGYEAIKIKWRSINENLEKCGEGQSPKRFLRYFLISRYREGKTLHDDDIYKWLVSPKSKEIIGYSDPISFVNKMFTFSERYSDLSNATSDKNKNYPSVTKIGMINQRNSRLHLILLLANDKFTKDDIEIISESLESFFFFTNAMKISNKIVETHFIQWAVKLRGKTSRQDIIEFIDTTLFDYVQKSANSKKFSELFMNQQIYSTKYRNRYIFAKIESTVCREAGVSKMDELEALNKVGDDKLHIEHILPQTRKENSRLPNEFSNEDDYDNTANLFGNITLLEQNINNAIGKINNLENLNWFSQKLKHYRESHISLSAFMCEDYRVGNKTQLNQFKDKYDYSYSDWNKKSIKKRQAVLLKLVLKSWKFNNKEIKP